MPVRVEYDKEANLAYIYLQEIKDGGVKETSQVTPCVLLDWDHEEHLVGIEILDARGMLPASLLASRDKV